VLGIGRCGLYCVRPLYAGGEPLCVRLCDGLLARGAVAGGLGVIGVGVAFVAVYAAVRAWAIVWELFG
jgi:hypothetical protein